jgi:hypothetical protein
VHQGECHLVAVGTERLHLGEAVGHVITTITVATVATVASAVTTIASAVTTVASTVATVASTVATVASAVTAVATVATVVGVVIATVAGIIITVVVTRTAGQSCHRTCAECLEEASSTRAIHLFVFAVLLWVSRHGT